MKYVVKSQSFMISGSEYFCKIIKRIYLHKNTMKL